MHLILYEVRCLFLGSSTNTKFNLVDAQAPIYCTTAQRLSLLSVYEARERRRVAKTNTPTYVQTETQTKTQQTQTDRQTHVHTWELGAQQIRENPMKRAVICPVRHSSLGQRPHTSLRAHAVNVIQQSTRWFNFNDQDASTAYFSCSPSRLYMCIVAGWGVAKAPCRAFVRPLAPPLSEDGRRLAVEHRGSCAVLGIASF